MLALDNDVLIKLAGYELLTPAVELLQSRFGQLAVLPTARFVVPDKADPRGHGQLNQVWPRVSGLAAASDIAVLERLAEVPGIDPGEVLLIAAAHETPSLFVATGDKRCLMALASEPGLRDVVQQLAGRVISLDQIVVALLDTEHAPLVCSNLCRLPVIDKAIQAVTGGTHKTLDELRVGFASYISHLEQTGIILYPGFELR